MGTAHIPDSNEKEDSEYLQIVDITLPDLKFKNMILEKTFFTRKFGIIG